MTSAQRRRSLVKRLSISHASDDKSPEKINEETSERTRSISFLRNEASVNRSKSPNSKIRHPVAETRRGVERQSSTGVLTARKHEQYKDKSDGSNKSSNTKISKKTSLIRRDRGSRSQSPTSNHGSSHSPAATSTPSKFRKQFRRKKFALESNMRNHSDESNQIFKEKEIEDFVKIPQRLSLSSPDN